MLRADTRTIAGWEAPAPADAAEASTLEMFVTLMLGPLAELAPARLSRLLDAIAECEYFHDLTMID
jgi:hypothetical protein